MKKTLAIALLTALVLPGMLVAETAYDGKLLAGLGGPGRYQLFFDIMRGTVPGMSGINKFGRNTSVANGTTADVWDGGAVGGVSLIWRAPTTNSVHTLASTDTNDYSTGTGARTVRIFGLPDWNTRETNEVITLNGTNLVSSSNSYVIIHRMKMLTWGTNGPNIGTISATAVTNSTITAQIGATKGQTQMTPFGIARGQTIYLPGFYLSINKASGAAAGVDVDFRVNPIPDQITTGFIVKHTISANSAGSSDIYHPFPLPKTIPGPAIIKIQVKSGANGMDVDAGFDGIIVND